MRSSGTRPTIWRTPTLLPRHVQSQRGLLAGHHDNSRLR
jgi:hypothetical protein